MEKLIEFAGPNGLVAIQSCLTCPMREEGLFCKLSPESLRDLNSIRHNGFYPRGARLFAQGQSAGGVFILCSGQAKLAAGSQDGKTITLRQVEAGEVLGLSSVIANRPYPATAETLAHSQASFIPRGDFLNFLRGHADVSLRVAEHLSAELHKAWEQTRMVALAPGARTKLSKFFLDQGARHGRMAAEGLRVHLNMTHEEIAESIGVTRETVSRLIADFKRQGIIRVKGGVIEVLQLDVLQALSQS